MFLQSVHGFEGDVYFFLEILCNSHTFTCRYLLIFVVVHTWGRRQKLSDIRSSTEQNYSSPQLKETFTANMLPTPDRKQIAESSCICLLPIQFPSISLSSVAEHILWPPLPLPPHLVNHTDLPFHSSFPLFMAAFQPPTPVCIPSEPSDHSGLKSRQDNCK